MGNQSSKTERKKGPYTKNDFSKLSDQVYFTPEEINILYKKFKSLSNSQIADNLIDIHEFQAALGLNSTAFTQRIFAAFDKDGSTEIDFFEFIKGLSALSPKATIEEKAKFCFDVYDIDKNGYIEKDELKNVLSSSLSGNTMIQISPEQQISIINATFKKMDENGDGQISLEEFTSAAKKNPSILACVNLNIESLLK
ncbi:hypothetical protein M9Y10_042470 [Tritrichomonas musculus]|uniref:EF-hand domain-containing protein n=1 Tax=Tritrichomonas musculus TaxID=1915356 RepID=A0ABR2GNV1_9EUKA